MMGREEAKQQQLFYTDFNLNQRVRQNHPLRKIAQVIDFNFSYEVTEKYYGGNGNVSIPPPIILKLMFLLIFYNVRSERELLTTLPERLDWLWFLGYDLDSEIPNHSILSKARNRWGAELFKEFFERIVWQCVEAGLVDGSKIFADSSLIEANASCNSIVDTQSLKRELNQRYKELEARLEEVQERNGEGRKFREVNQRHVSTTDPESGIVRCGRPKLYYKTHRSVESGSEVITAVKVTAGDVNEAHHLGSLLDSHYHNTEIEAKIVVADSKYGTKENYLYCDKQNINAHIPDLRSTAEKKLKKEIFSDRLFEYDSTTDTYRCPAGQILKPKTYHASRNTIDYAASRTTCGSCSLKSQCTKNKAGRTITRHAHQEIINRMRKAARSERALKDIRTRQHLMERSFAKAKRFAFDRARWRGLFRVSIQEYLVCAIQNIQILVKGRFRDKSIANLMKTKREIKTNKIKAYSNTISDWFSTWDDTYFDFSDVQFNVFTNLELFGQQAVET